MPDAFLGKGFAENGFEKPELVVGENYEFLLEMYDENGPDGVLKRPHRIKNIEQLEGVRLLADNNTVLHIVVSGMTQKIFMALENEGTGGPFLVLINE